MRVGYALINSDERNAEPLAGCRQVNEFGLNSMVNADHVDFL